MKVIWYLYCEIIHKRDYPAPGRKSQGYCEIFHKSGAMTWRGYDILLKYLRIFVDLLRRMKLLIV
jgi:hypothetical protein